MVTYQDFLFFFVFSQIDYFESYIGSLYFILFIAIELLKCVDLLFFELVKFLDSVSSNILSGTVIPSSLSGTSILHDASGCPRILLGCVHFSSFFPHLLSLDNFN